jgi:WD40 repeat protein
MIVLQGVRERVEFVQFSPDGRSLVAPFSGGVQIFGELTAGRGPTTVLDRPYIQAVRFTPDGQKLFLIGYAGKGFIHDLATGDTVAVPHEVPSPGTGYCDLTPDGRFVLAVQARGGREDQGCLSCRPVSDPASRIWSVSTLFAISPPLFMPEQDRFLLLERKTTPYFHAPVYVTRDLRTGATLAEIRPPGNPFINPLPAPTGRLLVARKGARITVSHTDNLGADPVVIRNESGKEFTGLAFHPSGRYLATSANDAIVKVYDTTTWNPVRAFHWDIGRLRSVTFSPDGMLAAAGGDRGKMVVWDVDW